MMIIRLLITILALIGILHAAEYDPPLVVPLGGKLTGDPVVISNDWRCRGSVKNKEAELAVAQKEASEAQYSHWNGGALSDLMNEINGNTIQAEKVCN